jgi:antitoxin YefM
MTTITASEARKNLFPLIKQVNDDHAAVHISSRAGNAVLVSEAEWNSIQETNYLLRNPVNAQRLIDSLARARRGEVAKHQLVDDVELAAARMKPSTEDRDPAF